MIPLPLSFIKMNLSCASFVTIHHIIIAPHWYISSACSFYGIYLIFIMMALPLSAEMTLKIFIRCSVSVMYFSYATHIRRYLLIQLNMEDSYCFCNSEKEVLEYTYYGG